MRRSRFRPDEPSGILSGPIDAPPFTVEGSIVIAGRLVGAIVAASVLGLRHGVDYDHVAAIADFTASADSSRRGLGLAVAYGLGHSTVIGMLGSLSIAFGIALPAGADLILQRVVGLTLIVLGAYVLGVLIRARNGSRIPSRWELIGRLGARLRSVVSASVADPPGISMRPRNTTPSPRIAVLVGMVHGIGAETPTQLGLFVLAAGVGGWGAGLLCVGSFAAGLLAMNVLMALVSTGMFGLSQAREPVYRGVMLAAGLYSVGIGLVFVFGGTGLTALL